MSYEDEYDRLWDMCVRHWNPDTRCESYLASCERQGGIMGEAAREVREDLMEAFPFSYEI